jgi:hypothetical protein
VSNGESLMIVGTSRWRAIARFVVLLVAAMASSASACTIRPSALYEGNEDLVRRTPAIVMARVTKIGTTPGDGRGGRGAVDVTFETVSILKGQDPRRFTLKGYLSNRVEGHGDFAAHGAPEFWAYDVGNTIQPGDCVAYGMFELGQQYLIFLRNDSHVRAYENIRVENDLWLRVVRLLIAAQGK